MDSTWDTLVRVMSGAIIFCDIRRYAKTKKSAGDIAKVDVEADLALASHHSPWGNVLERGHRQLGRCVKLSRIPVGIGQR